MTIRFASLIVVVAWCCSPLTLSANVVVGFGEADITPDVKGKNPVWLAGYGTGRRATGVHDPLKARCVVIKHDDQKFALASVDLVGLQYGDVLKVREWLKGFRYVAVSSTHNHEGPDVIGIWGKTHLHRGVDDDYVNFVIDRIVQTVKEADRAAVAVTARYGTAADETLLHDSRLPKIYDGVLRVVQFNRTSDGAAAGLLVQWNCHPEALGSKNTLITADFPYATVSALEERYGCPVAYFTGAVGGLMAPPDGRVKDRNGKVLKEGDFEFARVYGEAVAKLASRAIEDAQPIRLTPLSVSAASIQLPVENKYYRLSHALGVLRRDALVWKGEPDKRGEPLTPENAKTSTMAVTTEVGYLQLGELDVACIPGEIYPELVYGKYQEPADPGADFPKAPLEKSVVQILPSKKWLLLGLANDEIGYIIPKRQWDEVAPFAYGRKKSQYGEINSCGPDVAPIIMQALQQRVRAARRLRENQ